MLEHSSMFDEHWIPSQQAALGRGRHSSTSQLDLSCFVAETLLATSERMQEKVLTASRKVDECKPLALGRWGIDGMAR
jgi:hypothetical protein